MKRKPRYSIEPTVRGFIVMDNLMNMRKLGPFDGPTGKRTAAEHRDKLEREHERKQREA